MFDSLAVSWFGVTLPDSVALLPWPSGIDGFGVEGADGVDVPEVDAVWLADDAFGSFIILPPLRP